jgi:hypothetical protein
VTIPLEPLRITSPRTRLWAGNPLRPINSIVRGGAPAGPDPVANVGPSGTAPPTGDLNDFTLIKSEGFDVPVATGGWMSSQYYRPWWRTYNVGTRDTNPGKGLYDVSKANSVSNSCLKVRMFWDGANPIVSVNTFSTVADAASSTHSGQLYGQYSICMRARQMTGAPGMYKVVPLLWPISDVWPRDGEEDIPERSIGENLPIQWFHHYARTAGGQDVFTHPTARLADWHVYTLRWTPNLMQAWVDNVLLGQSTLFVPAVPMRWTWQFETTIVPTRSGLTSTGNTITASAHGYTNGEVIKFRNVDTASFVDTTQLYYIVGATTNTFQVSLSPGGAPINLGTATLLSVIQYPAPEDECLVEVDWGAQWRYTPGTLGTTQARFDVTKFDQSVFG